MKIAFCIDNSSGISFNGRRVSRDGEILKELQGRGDEICVFPESESMFLRAGENARVISDTCEAEGNCILFLEKEPSTFYGIADEIIIYCFNRDYPADLRVENYPEDYGFVLMSEGEFVGLSHDKITVRTYGKEK